jgi:hypothetical protein
MSQSVCLYSELEPYSGSISHNPSDLPRLIWDLKFACLFYDVVVLHRRNILEHPLALPAFEKLKPFVQSGQLWISANDFDNSPEDYLLQKVEQLEDFFGRGYIKKINAVKKISDRWLRVIPAEWKIRRCASTQTASVLQNIDSYLSKFKDKKCRQAHPLLDLVQDMRADNNFDKELALAKVGMLRGILHPTDLSEIATLIQAEFIRAGANFNNDAVIYPGKSVQCLTNPNFESLPFAHLTLRRIKERINSVGLDLNKFIDLPVEYLFDIAQSQQWLIIKEALLNDIFNVETQQEMRSVFSTPLSFPNQLERLLDISCYFKTVENSTPPLSPVFMPSPWALASQSLLGNANVATSVEVKKVSKTFILDIESRVLFDESLPNFQVELTPQQTNLFFMLVIAGESGLTLELIKQWLIELDAIKEEKLIWESQAKLDPKYDDEFFELRNRVDGLKRDINKKLKSLGLKIGGEKGREKWCLESKNSDKDFIIKLSGTVWGENSNKKKIEYIPPGLSKQSKNIWNCLREYYPGFVHATIIAGILEKEWNDKTGKQISKMVNKLKQQLKLKNEPWIIKQSSTGEYALMPKQL